MRMTDALSSHTLASVTSVRPLQWGIGQHEEQRAVHILALRKQISFRLPEAVPDHPTTPGWNLHSPWRTPFFESMSSNSGCA